MKFWSLKRIADRAFSTGIVLFAILLPLEIIPNRYISILSILVTALLLPRPALMVWNKKPSVTSISTGRSLKKILRLALPSTQLRAFGRMTDGLNLWLGVALLLPALAAAASTLANPAHVNTGSLRTLAILLLRAWIIAQFADGAHLRLFKRATIAVGALVTLFGFYQFFGDLAGLKHSLTFLRDTYSSAGTHRFPRVHSLAREPLLLANYLFIPMALLAAHLLHRKSYRLSALTLLSLMLVLVFTLNARSGMYAILAAFLALLYALRHKAKLAYRTILIAAGAIALGAFVLLAATGPTVFNQFIRHGAEFSDGSFQNRVKTWQAFPGIILHHPILGVGLGNSSRAILGPTCTVLPPDPPVFNNTYLTAASELGVVGLAAFLPLLILLGVFILKSIVTAARSPYLAYALILVAYAVQITSYEGLLNLRFWAVIGLALAAYRLMEHNYVMIHSPKLATA